MEDLHWLWGILRLLASPNSVITILFSHWITLIFTFYMMKCNYRGWLKAFWTRCDWNKLQILALNVCILFSCSYVNGGRFRKCVRLHDRLFMKEIFLLIIHQLPKANIASFYRRVFKVKAEVHYWVALPHVLHTTDVCSFLL